MDISRERYGMFFCDKIDEVSVMYHAEVTAFPLNPSEYQQKPFVLSSDFLSTMMIA
jgi:hypothetical protein